MLLAVLSYIFTVGYVMRSRPATLRSRHPTCLLVSLLLADKVVLADAKGERQSAFASVGMAVSVAAVPTVRLPQAWFETSGTLILRDGAGPAS